MKITSQRMVYLQPVLFKTISFHHQSQYFLQFQVKYKQSNMKGFVSAYPSIAPCESGQGYNDKKRLLKAKGQNKVQTQKFLVLFNDQSISLKGGCNFLVDTDKNVEGSLKIENGIESQLVIRLMRQSPQKDPDQLINIGSDGKAQKVGQERICINFDLINDYSVNTSFRHIVFPKDEYFSSFFFYIDFVHLGINVRSLSSTKLQKMNCMSQQLQKNKLKQMRKQRRSYVSCTLKSLLPFKQVRKLYKVLIQDPLQQFRRTVDLYRSGIKARLQYINNYQIEQPENIQSMSILRNTELKSFVLDLNYLQGGIDKDNCYFHDYYQTQDINEVYENMFRVSIFNSQQSRLINLNIRNVWDRMIRFKLKTLPEQFMLSALKFKIDRMIYITKFYATIDQKLYPNQTEIVNRLESHRQKRKNICDNSKFYNINEFKHSMLTFHSQQVHNVISNSSEKDQSQILVILVHGYKGSQKDMAKIRSFINTFTAINFLSLETLIKQKNVDIQTLGRKGAEEVILYLKKKPYISSINIIGFSLGGIIAKSILSHLQTHKQKFNLFLTLSSPHLGISQLQNCLVTTGVFWMKKINGIKNMKQLCCEPLNKKENDITLVSLSEETILSWFNHVVLIGSNQDTFVPKYSALMAYRGSNIMIEKIQQNNLQNIKSLDRVTVWFEYQQNYLEKLTGKKRHISFIQDDTFLEYIIIKYLQFF